MAKAGDWDDAGAREAFRVAVDRDVDRTVATPPFWILVGSVPQAEHYSSANGVWDQWVYPHCLACWRSGCIRSARAQRSSAGFCLRLPAQPFEVSIMAFVRALALVDRLGAVKQQDGSSIGSTLAGAWLFNSLTHGLEGGPGV